MNRYDIGTEDYRVKVRPKKCSRPRTKIRPDYSQQPRAQVYRIDRGRYHLRMRDSGIEVVAVKAREIPHRAVAIGDICALTGDLSGRKDTLARIVAIDPRSSQLRRSSEEGESAGNEHVIAANASQLFIVSAITQPQPRLGMIDRCLVAAYDGNMHPILVLTKCDLADPKPLIEHYQMLDLDLVTSSSLHSQQNSGAKTLDPDALQKIMELAAGKTSVLLGHSGVGKSTLFNALIPEAKRLTGEVNEVTGRGRHTSTSAVAFDLPNGGIMIDTPGVRTFGLGHIDPVRLLSAFPDLSELAEKCPRGCSHRVEEPECAFDTCNDKSIHVRTNSFRRLLDAAKAAWK